MVEVAGEPAPPGRRRSRWLVVPSGWLVFVCLVLPTFRFCDRGAAVPAVVLPPLWPFFVGGAIVALAASARRDVALSRGRRLLWFVRLGGAGIVAMALSVVWDAGLAWPSVLGVIVGVAMIVASWRRPSEMAVAVNAMWIGAGSVLFGLGLVAQERVPWAAHVYVGAATALTLGVIAWIVESLLDRSASRTAPGR